MTAAPNTPAAELPTPSVESAGYRAGRWLAARRVLANQLAKGRLAGFFMHWVPQTVRDENPTDTLIFAQTENSLLWKSGGLVETAQERALLHLPALRRFWVQELRQTHFDALRGSVARAWFLDGAAIPQGAVITGLEIPNWAAFGRKHDARHFELMDEKNAAHAFEAGKLPQLASERKYVLAAKITPQRCFQARYTHAADGRIRLADYQAMP